MNIKKEEVIEILRTVLYPGLSKNIVSFGFVKDVIIKNSDVEIILDITTRDNSIKGKLESEIKNKLNNISEISNLKVDININNPESNKKEIHTVEQKDLVPQIKHKIAVASGKGGVGKSTIAVNLAASIGLKDYRVGLLDADIYGPSIPMMMDAGLTKLFVENNKVIPVEKYGIKLMSIGFFIEKDRPLIWRGPMVNKAIQQLLEDVKWNELDYLIVDLPPGTGDAQLSISQSLRLSGVVIVTTPQDISLIDAVKGAHMFQRIKVPVIGIIENMSYFLCPKCGEKSEIFGSGGGLRESRRLNVPFLGEIPLDSKVRVSGDAGKPIALENNQLEISKSFNRIVDKIINLD